MDCIQTNRLGTKLTVQLYIALFYTHELQCLNVIHNGNQEACASIVSRNFSYFNEVHCLLVPACALHTSPALHGRDGLITGAKMTSK